jgi:amidase
MTIEKTVTQRISADAATHVEIGAHVEPQLRVAIGESFVIETQDNMFNSVTDDKGPALDRPPLFGAQYARVNPVGGPVFVEGVEAGDTLVVEIEAIDVRDWGWTGTAEGFGPFAGKVGWEELEGPWSTIIQHVPGPSGTLSDGEAVMTLDRESRWPLAPFIGTLATAPERGSENTLVTQGPWGGNIDVRDVRAGNKIRLNAAHAGGLLFAGDVHGSQGDSELSGMADETAAHLTLKCDVIKNRTTLGVCQIETPTSIIQCESARNAGGPAAAIELAYVHMVEWLTSEFGLSKAEAYMHMTANSQVRGHIYQATTGFLVVGVEFPKSSL